MSRRDLKKKIREIQEAEQVGKAQAEEAARRERVNRELDALLGKRRARIAAGEEEGTRPTKEERQARMTELREYVQRRKLEGGGGGR